MWSPEINKRAKEYANTIKQETKYNEDLIHLSEAFKAGIRYYQTNLHNE